MQEREGRRSAESGAFEPLWPAESHFSVEYMRDLVAEVEAALQLAAAEGGRDSCSTAGGSSGGASDDSSGSGGGSVHPALLTNHVHAAYAAEADGAARAELAKQADAALLAGVPELASPADAAARPAGGTASVPSSSAAEAKTDAPVLLALTAELPPAVLRSHWLLRLQLEWEAAMDEPFSLAALAERRRQRRYAEGWGGGRGAWLGCPA